jgi:hypothetical protein
VKPFFVVVKASSSCFYIPPCYEGFHSLGLLESEVAINRHRQNELSEDGWLVRAGHDIVAVGVAV